jgi:hypothetical protein
MSCSAVVFSDADRNTGWWFQTGFFFHFKYGMITFPLTNSYFSRWLKHVRTTNQEIWKSDWWFQSIWDDDIPHRCVFLSAQQFTVTEVAPLLEDG